MKKIIETIKRKWAEYLLEVIVIVGSILGAFALEQWGENRGNRERKKNYILSIIQDLKRDTTQMQISNREFKDDKIKLENLGIRLSNDYATIDSVIKIARNEFKPYFDPSNSFNNTTFLSIQNNGDLELLSPWLRKSLIELNDVQNSVKTTVQRNFDIYINSVNNYWSKYPLDDNSNIIKGKLIEEYWKEVNKNELLSSLNMIMTSKRIMEEITINARQRAYKRTKNMLDSIAVYGEN